MLAYIELDYLSKSKVKDLPREEYLRFRETFSAFSLPDWPEDGEPPKYVYCSEEILVELETDGPYLASLGLIFTIKRFKGSYFSNSDLHRNTTRLESNQASPTTLIQIAIPDFGLLGIRYVEVLEDACTNELQSMLDKGWRILAICPPNSQRRPDYILGRVDRE